jgi:hypothetical protein
MYASRRSPKLLHEEVESYAPRSDGAWGDLFGRVVGLDGDDGHIAKAVRAFASGEVACAGEKGKGKMNAGMWRKAGHMGEFLPSLGADTRK